MNEPPSGNTGWTMDGPLRRLKTTLGIPTLLATLVVVMELAKLR